MVGKKIWRIRLGHDLADARKQAIRCLDSTDQEIELAKLPTAKERQARRRELHYQGLQGLPAEEIFHEPRFMGSPDEAEALSKLPKNYGKTVDDIIDLVVQLKCPAAGTTKEYKGSLEKFRTH